MLLHPGDILYRNDGNLWWIISYERRENNREFYKMWVAGYNEAEVRTITTYIHDYGSYEDTFTFYNLKIISVDELIKLLSSHKISNHCIHVAVHILNNQDLTENQQNEIAAFLGF